MYGINKKIVHEYILKLVKTGTINASKSNETSNSIDSTLFLHKASLTQTISIL